MDTVLIYVCCKRDQITGAERRLGIMTERQMDSCTNPYWEYTRKMDVPMEKLEDLHIGNASAYLSKYEI